MITTQNPGFLILTIVGAHPMCSFTSLIKRDHWHFLRNNTHTHTQRKNTDHKAILYPPTDLCARDIKKLLANTNSEPRTAKDQPKSQSNKSTQPWVVPSWGPSSISALLFPSAPGHKIPIRAPNTSDIRIFMYF